VRRAVDLRPVVLRPVAFLRPAVFFAANCGTSHLAL
jgi:hypothetical protein